jgi:ubiquinone/menaquinone biosynthesis C-methylase UbiE
LIKRTSKKFIDEKLSKNPNWKILDIGCGYNANKYANVISDIQDLSDFYKDKKFIQLKDKKLPFKDNEFDYVITSHVMEHVEELDFFINEIMRISSSGYIELPTKLEDNLVFENKKEHIWQMDFNDVENKLLINKKIQFFEPIITVSTIKILNDIFRKSLVLELEWNDQINYEFKDLEQKDFRKISILRLFKKYISKKIRMIIK